MNTIFIGLTAEFWAHESGPLLFSQHLQQARTFLENSKQGITSFFRFKRPSKTIRSYFVQKSTFSQGVSPRFFSKNDQILKSAFYTCLFPKGSRRVVKLPWKQKKNVSGDVFGHNDLIGSFEKNTCISSKNRRFSKVFGQK